MKHRPNCTTTIMASLVSAWPNELVAALMQCILLRNDHIQLFSFLQAFPDFKKLVLLVSPKGAFASNPHWLADIRHLELPQLLTSFTAEQESNEGFGSLAESGKTPTLADSSISLFKIFLLPQCEKYAFAWSEVKFPSSLLAHVIKQSDAVVVGTSTRKQAVDQIDTDKDKYRGLQIIKQWCSHVSTHLKIYHQSDVNDIYLGIPHRSQLASHFHSLASFLKKRTDIIEHRIDETQQRPIPFWDYVTVKNRRAKYFAVMGNRCVEVRANRITNFKAVVEDMCTQNECYLPSIYLSTVVLNSVHAAFYTCAIPNMGFRNKKSHVMTISPNDVIPELVVENLSWSPDNPLGKALCESSRRGAECQADYNIEKYLNRLGYYYCTYVCAENVTLIGFPEEYLSRIYLAYTKRLVFKRLESESPRRSNQGRRAAEFRSLEFLSMEGTSNEKYKGTCIVWAPCLVKLSIVMLPKSTRVWDLSSLLFGFSNSPVVWPNKSTRTDLKILNLEYKGNLSDLCLRLDDIQCVVRSLRELSLKGLRPQFLGDITRNRVSTEETLAIFPQLRSLRIRTLSPLEYPTVSFDPQDFPVLKVLKLECEVSDSTGHYL